MIRDGLVRRRRLPAGLRLFVFAAVIVLVVALTVTAVTRVMTGSADQANAAPTESPAAAPVHGPAGLAKFAADPGSPAQGGDRKRNTLVLHDDSGSDELGNEYAIQAGNLASHDGSWNLKPVSQYREGDLSQYTAVIYVGVGDGALPAGLLSDLRRSTKPVLWMGTGVDQLFRSDPGTRDRWGWSPAGDDPKPVTAVRYERRLLPRHTQPDATTVRITVHDPASAKVLGEARHKDGSTIPWAVRSGSLTYVSEVPFSYAEPGDRSLAAADLISKTARPDGPDRRRALIRLEDVGPNSNPDDIKSVADYLAGQHVPFTLAVYPYYRDPNGAAHNGKRVSFRLVDQPGMVDALKYAVARGGTIALHGLSHQLDNRANPYQGTSANDYEFYLAHVDEADNVQLDGPVPHDSTAWAGHRMQVARAEVRRVGLADPEFFEFPHYTASAASYRAANEVFGVRYDQGTYFTGQCPDGRCTQPPAHRGELFQQFFPYPVRDIYGSVVIPENLLNVSMAYNNNPPRSPRDILNSAANMSVVRDAVASAYYHPFLGVDRLAQVVEGIKHLGYRFVSPRDLLE